jgi:hypothetical protein
MLTEYSFPCELDGDLIKRWFTDEFFDLYVWFDKQGEIASFQLCYDKPRDEQAFTWKRLSTYYPQRVYDGEYSPGKNKSTLVLLSDGAIDIRFVAHRFFPECKSIDREIAEFVYKALAFNKPVGGHKKHQRAKGFPDRAQCRGCVIL